MSPNTNRTAAQSKSVPDPNRQFEALAAFRARVNTGDYNAVVGRKLRRALHEAAADKSLDPELGALRLTLARLLDEEHDPSRLAQSVSRIVGIAAQIARLNHSPDSEFDAFRAHLMHELAAMDAEAAERSRQQPLALEPDFWTPISPSPTAVGEGLG